MNSQAAPELRIALLADIHGNCIALDAVLEDIERRGGADEFWILGDVVALGPQPVAVLERLQALERVVIVRGNADRYIVTGERPTPSVAEVQADPTLAPILAEVAATFAWTLGAISETGYLPFLETWPAQYDRTLPDGTRVLAVHASPMDDDGLGFSPIASAESQIELLKEYPADLVCVGHTHWPLDMYIGRYHVVNPGSVSNPVVPGLHASYAILEAGASGYHVQHYAVAYDREAVIRLLEEQLHPAPVYISNMLRGEKVRMAWGEPDVYELKNKGRK